MSVQGWINVGLISWMVILQLRLRAQAKTNELELNLHVAHRERGDAIEALIDDMARSQGRSQNGVTR